MPKKPKAYFRPNSLDEALAMLAKPGHIALGGGAHLLATEAGLDTDAVVDLQGSGLSTIDYDAQRGVLVVGAAARLVDLSDFLQTEDMPGTLPTLLSEAIHRAGPNTYRNAATVGGVIASRLTDSELLAALLVAETSLDMRLPQPERVSLSAYLGAEVRPIGLITAVHVAIRPGQSTSARVARTPADYPIVSIIGWVPDGQAARLAATGISKRPLRLKEAEAAIATILDESTIDDAAAKAQLTTEHPGDFRGDTAYRAEMAAVLTRRVLRELAAA